MNQSAELAPLEPCSGTFRIGSMDRAGRFPRSWDELTEWFPDELVCHEYLAYLRWRTGFVCPACSSTAQPGTCDRALLRCSSCGELCSATTGTPFSGLSLTRAFRALWELLGKESGADAGVFASEMKTSLGMAWHFLEGLRPAMVRHDEDRLVGQVHVGQVPVAFEERGAFGKQLSRAQVIVAAEVRNDEVTRVRFGPLQGCAPAAREDFLRRAVAPGSIVRTARTPIYDRLRSHGYGHQSAGVDLPPGAQRVASLLGLWLYGCEAASIARLGYFLDELAFRYNHRFTARSEDRQGYLFFSLLRRSLAGADPSPG